MSTFEEIRGERLKKLKAIKDAGVNPFPVSVKRDINIKDVMDNFENFLAEKKLTKKPSKSTEPLFMTRFGVGACWDGFLVRRSAAGLIFIIGCEGFLFYAL